MKLTDIGDMIRTQPMAWRDIPEELRAIAAQALLPVGGFTPEQRYYLARWWLTCTDDDVREVNALLPEGTQVSAITVNGKQYLGGDLLTDALTPGNTYHPALPVLERLVCAYIEPEDMQTGAEP